MNIPFGWLGSVLIIFLLIVFLLKAVRIFREYERGVVFTLGRFWKVKGPGLVIIIPIIQQAVRVELRGSPSGTRSRWRLLLCRG